MVLDAIVMGSAACSELYYYFTCRLDAVVYTSHASQITKLSAFCIHFIIFSVLMFIEGTLQRLTLSN